MVDGRSVTRRSLKNKVTAKDSGFRVQTTREGRRLNSRPSPERMHRASGDQTPAIAFPLNPEFLLPVVHPLEFCK